MNINYFSEDIDYQLKRSDLVSNWIQSTCDSYKKVLGDLNIIFVSEAYLLEVNQQYLNHDYHTDVITFDYGNENLIAGDIFISIDMIKHNAEKFKVSFTKELSRVIIHGLLHLIGYQDNTNELKSLMRSEEDKCLLHAPLEGI